jgi:hypothetical protein
VIRSKAEIKSWLDTWRTRATRSGHVLSTVTRGGPWREHTSAFGPKGHLARSEAAVKDADRGGTAGAARSVLDGRVSGGHDPLGRRLVNRTPSRVLFARNSEAMFGWFSDASGSFTYCEEGVYPNASTPLLAISYLP